MDPRVVKVIEAQIQAAIRVIKVTTAEIQATIRVGQVTRVLTT